MIGGDKEWQELDTQADDMEQPRDPVLKALERVAARSRPVRGETHRAAEPPAAHQGL